MKLGKVLGCMAVVVGSLLVTLSAVSANHFIAGGVLYAPTRNLSETAVQCRFLGVKSRRVPGKFVTPATIQCTLMHQEGSTLLELLLSGTALEPFDIVEGTPEVGYHTLTLRGQMRSLLVREREDEQRRMTELASFEAVGITIAPGNVPGPGADPESLRLTLVYSARRDIGPLLARVLPDLVRCDPRACTVVLAGPVIDGEMESHTAGGE